MVHRGMALRLVKTTHNNMFAASKSGSADAKDPQFNYVTMLLHGNGTNGAQNNTFVDSSTNNFSITRNGNTTQGTFSPYGSNWSNYFDGSGDYLTVPDSANTEFGSGDFTVECWAYYSSISGTPVLIDKRANTGGYSPFIFYTTGGTLVFYSSSNGSSYDIANGVTIGSVTTGTWYHVAVSRSGSSIRLFLNGTLANTITSSAALVNNSDAWSIGGTVGGNYLTGYLSNIRFLTGSAIYTSAFTPPTAPLTAITNTSLLTCADNRFIDDSTNNFTITKNGDVSVQRFSPFSPTSAYSTSVIGGSGYFDGSGDYLSLSQQTALSYGTGDFTIEAWVYPLSVIDFYGVLDTRGTISTSGSLPYIFGLRNSSGVYKVELFLSDPTRYLASTTIPLNAWTHIAVSRSSGTLRIFVNGVVDRTDTGITASIDANGTTQWIGGVFNTLSNYGYLSDVRVVKGTAVYTSAFTPPTAPVTAVTNTQLLLSYTNAGVLDNAMMNDLETVGNAQISTSVKKYGTGSIALDGTGDYLNCANPSSVIHQLGTGDFTVEFWAYLTNSGNDNGPIFDTRSSSGNGLLIRQGNGAGGIANRIDAVITASATASSGTISFNTWFHLAVVRSSGTLKVYYNGTGGTGVTATGNITGTNAYIGAFFDSLSINIAGYFDDFRVTKGVARYTSNFTAPTVAFADKG
jgi:hypothetical protein